MHAMNSIRYWHDIIAWWHENADMVIKNYENFDVRPLDFWTHLGPRNDLIIQIDVFFDEEFKFLIDFDIWIDIISKIFDFLKNRKISTWGTLAPQEVGCEALSSILNACHEFNPILIWCNRMMTWKMLTWWSKIMKILIFDPSISGFTWDPESVW